MRLEFCKRKAEIDSATRSHSAQDKLLVGLAAAA
jgi:hypothetical protein